ncbi:hypothetical protein OG455_05405 [Kitasatospora sp. NBC_01287]|uniref:hypothetical protein n=1 Tax=Kitasatospora sp. NBC_01287 TaxID=2903573 RepID=UPI00225897DA|nr:hypothetical protein [Kitasatospora sp. NBC_01287]MCX4744964.1 hypothetical protein [Kitasatospora sp. NBC_01287]
MARRSITRAERAALEFADATGGATPLMVTAWFGPTAPWTIGGGIGLLVGLATLPALLRRPSRAELLSTAE